MRYCVAALFMIGSLCVSAQDLPENPCEGLYWQKRLAVAVTLKELTEFKDVKEEVHRLQMEYEQAVKEAEKESLEQKLNYLTQYMIREEEDLKQASSELKALSLQYDRQCGEAN